MKFLKNNLLTILTLVLFFSFVMTGNAQAATQDVFGVVQTKLSQLFQRSKFVIFLIGGFGLIALAFQAIFGKLKWAWFAALAFGLAVVAAAGGVVGYATNKDNMVADNFSDSLN